MENKSYTDYKYKKYTFDQFKKEVNSNKHIYDNFLVHFFNYINILLHYQQVKTFDVYYNMIMAGMYKHLKSYDSNLKLFVHALYDKKTNKCIAYCLTFFVSDNILNDKYYSELNAIFKRKNDKASIISYIKNVVIDSSYRGKGLCNYFISRVKKNCAKNNIDYVLCEINVDRVPQSAKCFKNNGFTQTTIRSYRDSWYFYIKL